MKRVFSGIQPTGNLTIGNYLGAIKNWLNLQDEYECIYCLVDLHAITVPQDPKALRDACLTNYAIYLASGLDPEKSIIFIQSAVAEHSELGWILSCQTPLGWLNRMTQFKDKSGKNQQMAPLALMAYPVLMAADILLYKTDIVPVGEDQTQHLEFARDTAGAFNRNFNIEYFKLPNILNEKTTARIMSLRDGTKKMSKSDPSDMTRINMTDTPDVIENKIKKATTDSITGISYDPENRPEITNLINIFSGFSGKSVEEIVKYYESLPTQAFKQDLIAAIIEKLKPIQDKANVLLKDRAELLRLSTNGADKARHIASQTMKEVKEIVGFL